MEFLQSFAAFGLGAMGIWMLYADRKTIWQALSAYRWMATDGTVTEIRDDSFTIPGINRTNSGVVPVTYMEARHIYEYTVGGKVYQSHNSCFGGHVEQAEASFPVGAKVKVYFNPMDPQMSVLKRGIPSVMIIGLVLICCAAYVGWRILF